MSIVLVIIGLIVGGVLVGQDLIRAAQVRATVTQIEKYNTAVNTFRGKYNALPGDMNTATAAQFGFLARGANAGEGDGNGVIEGNYNDQAGSNNGLVQGAGETSVFWVDLSQVSLIDGSFTTAGFGGIPGGGVTPLTVYFPQAKVNQGAYIYVNSSNGINYFGLLAITSVRGPGAGAGGLNSTGADGAGGGLTVQQAYSIDQKIDDGLPQSGVVTAQYVNGGPGVCWAGPNSAYVCGPAFTAATPGIVAGVSYGTCFNNGNVNGAAQYYSTSIDRGADFACALSFRFQ